MAWAASGHHEIVAPRAGAWIEARPPWHSRCRRQVAPRAGAWIEAGSPWMCCPGMESLPARERGLKQRKDGSRLKEIYVAPRAGAWIEASWLR